MEIRQTWISSRLGLPPTEGQSCVAHIRGASGSSYGPLHRNDDTGYPNVAQQEGLFVYDTCPARVSRAITPILGL